MRPLIALACAALVTVACSTPAAPPPTTDPTATDPTKTAPVTTTDPASSSNGSACPCTAPFACRTVVGMRPDSARDECWIPCVGDDQRCPDGLRCDMLLDGPGHVCRSHDD